MLESVLQAVCTALTEQGARAVREFPAGAAELQNGAVICVGCEKCRCLSPGLGDYLGMRRGEGGAADTELYGRQLELTLSLEVLASFELEDGAGACAETAGSLEGLLAAMPAGIKREKLEIGEMKADRELECFRCICRLYCTAYLVAEGSGDEGEFLDFILKGTVEHVD